MYHFVYNQEGCMPVKYKIFPIPITNPEEQEEALNQFLCIDFGVKRIFTECV